MKTSILCIFLILLVTACGRELNPLLEMVVLKDSTDDIEPLSYEDVRQFLDYSNAELLWYAVSIRQRELSNIRHGHISECSLVPGQPNKMTEQQRKLQVKGFLKDTETMLKQKSLGTAKEQSYLYYGIASELNELSKSNAIHKVAIIASDLLENTPVFSIYRPLDRQLLLQKPDSVIELFQQELPLQDLSGITVHIVYQATPSDHELFTAMSKLYVSMLRGKGAKVQVAGNLIVSPVTAL
jgi:hypothetical protein